MYIKIFLFHTAALILTDASSPLKSRMVFNPCSSTQIQGLNHNDQSAVFNTLSPLTTVERLVGLALLSQAQNDFYCKKQAHSAILEPY